MDLTTPPSTLKVPEAGSCKVPGSSIHGRELSPRASESLTVISECVSRLDAAARLHQAPSFPHKTLPVPAD